MTKYLAGSNLKIEGLIPALTFKEMYSTLVEKMKMQHLETSVVRKDPLERTRRRLGCKIKACAHSDPIPLAKLYILKVPNCPKSLDQLGTKRPSIWDHTGHFTASATMHSSSATKPIEDAFSHRCSFAPDTTCLCRLFTSSLLLQHLLKQQNLHPLLIVCYMSKSHEFPDNFLFTRQWFVIWLPSHLLTQQYWPDHPVIQNIQKILRHIYF